MPDVPDEVYALCLAVAGTLDAAQGAAVAAVRRGGWSRTLALGHAAWEAGEAAPSPPSGDGPLAAPPAGPGGAGGLAVGVAEAARWLAATRPPEERALLYLADTAGLAGGRLARAVAAPETEAARRLASTAGKWEAELDPALMAWLGPGGCRGLAAVLGFAVGPEAAGGAETGDPEPSPGPDALTAARALELAPVVAAHVAGCDACSDRLRAMVSVRELLSREPSVPAPATVRAAYRSARARPPTPLPGALGRRRWPGAWPGRSRGRWPTAAAGVVAAAGAAGVAYLAWPSGPASPGANRSAVSALSRLPPGGSSLVLDPVATSAAVLHLSDVGQRPVSWQAATTAPWLRVAPAAGQLSPGQSVSLALDVVGNQAAGLRATVTVNGSDGSVAAARFAP